MAKKKSGRIEDFNKSQVIRDLLRQWPTHSPTEIANKVDQEHGVRVTSQYVSTIKSAMLKKDQVNGGPPAKPTLLMAGIPRAVPLGEQFDPVAQILAAATYLRQCPGGVTEAIANIQTAAKIQAVFNG